jgi:hypothetical protein
MAKESAIRRRTSANAVELGISDMDKEDILKGIVLREILGPPKAFER